MKFKIGDRVQVTENVGCAREDYVGTVKVINGYFFGVEFDDAYDIGFHSCDGHTKDGRGYWLLENQLERIDTISDQKIVITNDGKRTTATLYNGKRVVKRAESKCHPDDEFDLMVGANLAVDRLSDKRGPKYFTGKVVCIKSTDDGFRQGKVYDVTDGELVGYHRWVKRCTSVKHINDAFGGVYEFIELVED